jgi:uncharacterized protein (TIGR01777 family)
MLPPFKLGLGGPLGNGRQHMSWVALDDLVEMIQFSLLNASLHGAANAVAPNPVTNRDFTRALGAVLKRPTPFPVPSFAIRALFGEMGQELLLSSTRAVPSRLRDAGFGFAYPEIRPALEHVLR